MSAEETTLEVSSIGIGRPGKEWTREYMTDAKEMQRLLNRTQALTDEAYEDLVHDYGYRLALLVLRAAAVSGNIKALELYFKIVKDTKASRRSKDVKVSATPENAAFVRVARTVESDTP